MEEVLNHTFNKVTKTDFCYFIDMALQNKMSWTMLSTLLKDLTRTSEDSRQVISILLSKLEVIHMKLLKNENIHKNIEDLGALANNEQFQEFEVENVDKDLKGETIGMINENDNLLEDDIEILKVIKERIDDNICEDDMQVNKNDEKGLGIEEAYDSVGEIDNEWYTFVTNDKPCDRGTEILDEPKEIEGFKARESKLLITSKDSDSTSKTSSFQCITCQKFFSTAKHLKIHEMIHNSL